MTPSVSLVSATPLVVVMALIFAFSTGNVAASTLLGGAGNDTVGLSSIGTRRSC